MKQEITLDEWFAKVKAAYTQHGLSLPEGKEIMELAFMEYLEEEKSPDEFIKKMPEEQMGSDWSIAEQEGNQSLAPKEKKYRNLIHSSPKNPPLIQEYHVRNY